MRREGGLGNRGGPVEIKRLTGKWNELFVRRIISREMDETGALSFTDGSGGAVFKYNLNFTKTLAVMGGEKKSHQGKQQTLR